MYNYAHRDKFYQDGTFKEYLIIFAPVTTGGESLVFSNEDLEDESFELFDSIMDSESLSFSNCLSCYVRFVTYYEGESLMNRLMAVYEVIDNDSQNPIPIGFFFVKSDTLRDDSRTREIIAYDFMYDVINTNVTDWYNALEFPITQKDMRDSLFYEFGIEQDNTALINDDLEFYNQLSENDIISGSTIVKAICDINGVFAHIGKDGILHWITLDSGDIHAEPLYPSSSTYPGENTFPGFTEYSGNITEVYKSQYKENSVKWANYKTEAIDGIQIRNENNEIAYQLNAEADNPYTVISNFLCYNLEYGQYETIAERLYDQIKDIQYVPIRAVKMGDPCLEVSDRIVLYVKDEKEVVTYLFTKHSKGILVPFEDIETKGTLYLSQYDIGRASNNLSAKVKNLDNRVGNMEKSGSGPLQIRSVRELPTDVELNVLYLIQGEVQVN